MRDRSIWDNSSREYVAGLAGGLKLHMQLPGMGIGDKEEFAIALGADILLPAGV
ncbi:hypothetical protein [Mycobacterium leprae]|uniref:hypothetical protein n=1 Tax=Mycobacterium leprae TaxID=1769 RepID=UPI0002FB42BB|nr:hypothetical protein [Mycobacterium leprae]